MEEDIEELAWNGRGEVEWPGQLLPHSNPKKVESEPKDSRRMSLVPREGRCDSKNPLKIFVSCILHSSDVFHVFDHIFKITFLKMVMT